MAKNVHSIVIDGEKDPDGRPLALVIFKDRRFEYVPAEELQVAA